MEQFIIRDQLINTEIERFHYGYEVKIFNDNLKYLFSFIIYIEDDTIDRRETIADVLYRASKFFNQDKK